MEFYAKTPLRASDGKAGDSKQNKVGKSTPEFAGSDSKGTGFRA
jgi:hypothetical protein